MKKAKPLLASLFVVLVAFAGMAIWRFSGRPAVNGANDALVNAPANTPSDDGLKYEWTKLEQLPPMDPLGLWPRDGARLSAPEFWIMWNTNKHVECRLLATKDRRDWYNLGRTAGEKHFLTANLGYFDSSLAFSVEFEENGKRYRSKSREVSFGKGAAFGQRRYKFTLGKPEQQIWELEIIGGDASALGQEAFLTTMFPDDLVTFVVPTTSTDTVKFGINNAGLVEPGCSGFLEVYDNRTGTYDRVLIELNR
jgi:hypothetical protein